jgi:hypothetical protein
MRPTLIIVLIGMLTFLGNNKLQAQALDETLVKIVPTANAGIIKVIYGAETLGPVNIAFVTTKGEVGSDKIEVGSYPTGISKRYNIKSISDRGFWVKVSSPQLSVTYRISPLDNGSFTATLEKASYYQAIVRRNN